MLSGRYISWLLRCSVSTYTLSPLLYEWLWPHTDAYHNAYAFWGEGYFVILFLFNFILSLPALYLATLAAEKLSRRQAPVTMARAFVLVGIFLLMLLAQLAVKSLLFTTPYFTLLKDAAGPTFAAALVSILALWPSLSRQAQA
ncbi:MAG: hypothetical protein MUF29_11065 [Chitinophagaceae bacterium]|nr:hypothetical protein [Chitinophagaceae bacterium]